MLIGLVAVALERRGVLTRDPSPVDASGHGWWTRERARWHVHRDRFRARDAGVLLAAGGLLSYMIFCLAAVRRRIRLRDRPEGAGLGSARRAAHVAQGRLLRPSRARLTGILDSIGRAGAAHARVPGRLRSSCCAGSGGATRCTPSRSWPSRCSEPATSKAWVAICSLLSRLRRSRRLARGAAPTVAATRRSWSISATGLIALDEPVRTPVLPDLTESVDGPSH